MCACADMVDESERQGMILEEERSWPALTRETSWMGR